MIRAMIIDDEKNAIITLQNDLAAYCHDITVIGSFTQATEALQQLATQQPDLIFLDIDMPVMNGFDFIEQLDMAVKPAVIFTTAYSEFAIKAFKVNALDYLLKPIDPEELQAAVNKV